MTDAAVAPPAVLTRRRDIDSDAARARVRQRYRTERRFRAYGLIAIVVTTVFLVTLVADILRKGLPAFTQHSLVLARSRRQSPTSRAATPRRR
jgi:phosphate transport system permease protein